MKARFLVVLLVLIAHVAQAAEEPGTKVLKWKDGKKAAFMLAFDDSAPSQLKNVIPELNKRKIPGTFYLVTGNSLWAGIGGQWKAAAKSPYIVVANHTFTHKGENMTPENLDAEFSKCNEVLYSIHPERKQPYLLAWGKPGGFPWLPTPEQTQAALDKNNLVSRPGFWGPPIHQKSAAECVATIDKALAKGEMGHLDMHGVGGDWLNTPLEWFTAILDKLEQERDQLWLTDGCSWAKYTKERDTAEIKVLASTPTQIKLSVTTKMDPQLYDEPLTLSTRVPASWKAATVTQGTRKATVPVKDGAAIYDVVPGAEEAVLQSAP